MSETSKIFGHFNVRILRKGEKYGLEDCLIHKERKPLVEFYDYRHRDDKEWKRGQFVSRYYAETILKHDPHHGLSLDGGIPAWTVPAESMRQILTWLRQEFRADEFPTLSAQLAEENLNQYALRMEANKVCNQYARALIRTMRNENGGICWLGKFNPDFGGQRPGLQKYTHGMIVNFSCDLVLPQFDWEIDRMLREYRTQTDHVLLIEKTGNASTNSGDIGSIGVDNVLFDRPRFRNSIRTSGAAWGCSNKPLNRRQEKRWKPTGN